MATNKNRAAKRGAKELTAPPAARTSTFRETLELYEGSKRNKRGRGRRPLPVDAPKQSRRRGTLTMAQHQEAERERLNNLSLLKARIGKEIGHIRPDGSSVFQHINWERRAACRDNLQLYCETYLGASFTLGWSEDQLKCIRKSQIVGLEGGKFALAMPRGGGKTTICRGAINWMTDYGHKRHIFNIGSTEIKADETVDNVKVQHYSNPLLYDDFPELCWPVRRLEGHNRLSGSQTFMGIQTHPHWGSDYIRFPTMLLPKELLAPTEGTDAKKGEPLFEWYLRHDPKSLIYLPHYDAYAPASAGTLLKRSGIDGAVRGEAPTNPITLEILRPDMVLLDDVQKDHKADSPVMTEKLIRLIEGAVTGLAGPTAHIDVLMPCTVIREGDAADTYLNPLIKPEYQGERCQLVTSWPAGITDYEIGMDTEEGKLWNEYAEIRRQALKAGKPKEATDFYVRNRAVMDRGFEVSWKERYDRRSEVSAQQFAMDLRLELGPSFLPEYQNIGRQLIQTADILITSKQLAVKCVDTPRDFMPPGTQIVCTHLDIQDEIFFWLTFACDMDFNGVFVSYGTFPEVKVPYFTKAQTASWSMLTKMFFEAHPDQRKNAVSTSAGRVRAPLDRKIYYALSKCVPWLLNKEYTRSDSTQRKMKTMRLSIDTRWGQASETIKRYIRESGLSNIVPYYGQAFPPTHKQLEEYEMREGWLFEQQKNPLVREPKWVIRPNPDGVWYMAADVNRLKDFLFTRLAAPLGSAGSVAMHKAPAEYHELFANHVCNSEYPEPQAARGIVKNIYIEREGTAFDNDYLDCAAGCMAVASELGATVKTSDFTIQTIRRSLSGLSEQKRGNRTSTGRRRAS